MNDTIPWLARWRISIGGVREAAWFDLIDFAALVLCGGRIGGGLFAGMDFRGWKRQAATAPKVIGSYEAELIPVMAWMLQAGFERFINIGAAEGYYAVGVARGAPQIRVDAFEGEPRMRAALTGMATRNGVEDRISQHGWADFASVRAVVTGANEPFMLVDIEGGEQELLDPVEIPALVGAWMLVELHLSARPELLARLRARFAGTHQLYFYEQQDRAARLGQVEGCRRFHWLARFRCFRRERRGAALTPWLLLRPHTARRPLEPRVIATAREL